MLACMRGMRAHSCLYVYIRCNKRNHRSPCLIFTSRLHACSCPCSSRNVSPASNNIGSAFFPTLHSFNVVLARPRSVHLASSQGAGAPLTSAHNKYKNPKWRAWFRRFKFQAHSVFVCARVVFACEVLFAQQPQSPLLDRRGHHPIFLPEYVDADRKRRHPALHGHANTSTCTRKHKHMHTYTPMHA